MLAMPFLLYGSAAVLIALAILALRRHESHCAGSFAGFCFSSAIYALFYGAEIQSLTEAQALWFNRIQYIGLAGIPVFALLFLIDCTGVRIRRRALWIPLITAIPILTLLFRWTDSFHGLVYRSVSFENWNGLMILNVSPGLWYWMFIGYLNAALLTVFGVIGRLWKSAQPSQRHQMRLLLLGGIFPWVGHIAYQVWAMSGTAIDLSPFGFCLTGLIWMGALTRAHFFEISPFVRHLVFNSIREGVLILDKQGRLVDYNPAAASLLKISPNQPLGQTYAESLAAHPDLIQFVESGKESGECSVGQTIVTIRSNPIIAPNGKPRGTLIMLSDITSQRAAEEQLRQSQKMDSIGRLAGGMAHDFNSMLQAILGFSELAQLELPADHPASAHIREIESAAQHSAGITKQLLTFSRRKAPQASTLDLAAIVSSRTEMLAHLLGEKIRLIYRGPEVPISCSRMDESHIDQILANLISNARDAIQGEGVVSIEVREVILDEAYCNARKEASPGTYVSLAVYDNGCGMTADVRSHLFEPFFTTKGPGRGIGLGLAMIYGIVRQYGGFIHVYSEPGKGSAFKLYFPAASGRIRQREREISQVIRGGSESIWFIDDEEAIRQLGKTVLERYGYRVNAAANANDILKLAETSTTPPDLLITDVIMPAMNGKELAAALSAKWPRLKVLYISGYSSDILDARLEPSGKFHYLPKPFSSQALAAEVRSILDESPNSDPARPAVSSSETSPRQSTP